MESQLEIPGINKLRRNTILRYCTPQELELIEGETCSICLKKDQVIFHERTHPLGVHLITSGRVKLCKTNEEGKELVIRIAETNELIGFEDLLADKSYSITAISLGETQATLIPKAEFIHIINNNKRVTKVLLREIRDVLDYSENKMLNMAYDSVTKRLCTALLSLYSSYKEDEIEAVTIPLSRKDLAKIIGTSMETTVRMVKKLMHEGIIGFNGRKIVIENVSKLERLNRMRI